MSSNSDVLLTKPLPLGKIITVMDNTETVAVTRIARFTLDAESILVSLFVEAITSGTIDVTVWTEVDVGKDVAVITFPTISAVTTNLLLKKAAACMSRVYVKVVSTGACKYDVRARGISLGEANVRIQGPTNVSSSTATSTNITTVLIPATLDDGRALIIKNHSNAGTLYIGFTPAVTVADGYPLGPHESLGIDLEAGAAVYSITDGPVIDVRILRAGG